VESGEEKKHAGWEDGGIACNYKMRI